LSQEAQPQYKMRDYGAMTGFFECGSLPVLCGTRNFTGRGWHFIDHITNIKAGLLHKPASIVVAFHCCLLCLGLPHFLLLPFLFSAFSSQMPFCSSPPVAFCFCICCSFPSANGCWFSADGDQSPGPGIAGAHRERIGQAPLAGAGRPLLKLEAILLMGRGCRRLGHPASDAGRGRHFVAGAGAAEHAAGTQVF
jgi:hypothetical protein